MKRSVLIAIPAVLVTLVIILLVAPGFIDWSQYKTQAQDQIKTTTGYNAELRGPLSLALLPAPHVSISDVQIAAPEGSAGDYLMRLGRADVHLAFIPLLSGKVEFRSITLVEPAIVLEVLADGRKNWMTPELEAMQGAEKKGPGRQVSLENISIEKGAFTYTDRSKNAAPTTVNDINMTAQADTLQGPFKAEGSFAVAGHTIETTATTGAIDETGNMSLNAEGTVKPSGMAFKYAGVVTTKEPFQAQGETALEIESLADLTGNKALDEALKLKGLMTASQEKVLFKNASFALGKNEFTGDVTAEMNPLNISANFRASDTVSLDKFLGSGSKKSGPMLPQTLTMPTPFDAGIKLSAPGLIYNGQLYKSVILMASKQDKIFALDFAAGDIPGRGKVDAKAALKFAAKSISKKDGSEVYSEPALAVTVKGDSQNVAATAEAVTGMKDLKFLQPWKTGAVDANVAIQENTFVFNDTTLTLGGSPFKVDGSYNPSGAMDLTVSGQAKDAKAIMKMAGMDVSKMPPSLEGAAISVAAKGTRDKIAAKADIKALNGDLIASANVADPFGKPQYSNFVVQANHPNLADALQKLSPGSARYVSLEKPSSFYAEVEPKGNVYSLKNMKANVAGTPVTGKMDIETGGAKTVLRGDLTFDDLVIQTQKAASGTRWSSEAMDTAWINGYEMDLNIVAQSLTYQAWVLQKPVLDVSLHGGKLDVTRFDSTLFGGEMKMTASMQGNASNKGFSAFNTNATFRSVSMEQLVKALAGSRIIQASGDVDLDMNLATAGASQAALVAGLNGKGTTQGKNLVMKGFDLNRFAQTLGASAKPGQRLAGLWQSAGSGGSTAFDSMDGAFTVTKGIVNIDRLDMDGTATSMATSGTLNLPNWTLATAHKITFKENPEIQPYTIKLSGSLSNPAQSLGQGIISGVIQEQIQNKFQDLLGDQLGLPKAQQPQPAAQTAPAPSQAAPAAGDEAATTPVQEAPEAQPPAQPLTAAEQKEQQKQQEQQQQQEAIKSLLQGVLGGQ